MRRGRLPALAAAASLLALLAGGAAAVEWRPAGGLAVRTLALGLAPGEKPGGLALDASAGHLFVSTADASDVGRVRVFDLYSGRLSRAIGPFTSNVGVTVAEDLGRAFVNDMSGSVTVLDTRTGAPLETMAGGGDRAAIAVDARRRHVFLTNYNGDSVSVFDARGGKELRRIYLGIFYEPDGLILDELTGHILVTSRSKRSARVVDPATGRVLRTVGVVGAFQPAVDTRRGWFLVTTDQGLLALDAASGRTLRAIHLNQTPYVALLTDTRTGQALVGGDTRTSMVDVQRGIVTRTIAVPLPYQTVVDERSRRAFIVDPVGSVVRVVDTRGGTVVRTVVVAANPGFPVLDARRERVFVTAQGTVDSAGRALGMGAVTVLDARGGTVVGTVAVGVNPSAVAVDERTGHAFVANSGGAVVVPDNWGWMPGWLRRRLPFLSPPGPRTRVVPGSVSVLDQGKG